MSVLSSRLSVVRLVTRSPENGPIYSGITSIFLETFEVRATGFERASWQSVDGTGETVVVVGQDTIMTN